MQEAAKCMSDRQKDALQRLVDVCHSGSLSEYSKALQHAASCGVEAVLVAKQKQAWDSRCSEAAQELSAAVHAKDFAGGEFSRTQQKVHVQSCDVKPAAIDVQLLALEGAQVNTAQQFC